MMFDEEFTRRIYRLERLYREPALGYYIKQKRLLAMLDKPALGYYKRDRIMVDPDIDDLLDCDEEDIDFIIPKVIARGDRTIITGPEGGGKTTFVRQLAVQCASGIHPFTLEQIDPIRVLFLDFENPKGLTLTNFRWIRSKTDSYKPGYLIPVLRPEGINLCDPDDFDWMRSLVKRNATELLICGPFYKMVPGDLIQDEVAKPALMQFDRLRAEFNIAVWIEAHQPLGGDERPTAEDSSDLTGLSVVTCGSGSA